jgi:hypothetical protein
MSKELRVTFETAAANLYVIVRRISDDYVWNGSAFEVFADGNLATYDVALADEGGDLYDGDMPAMLPAGDYEIRYYERAGGAPATSDLALRTDLLHWDGAAVSSSSTITLSPYALTTLDNQKRFLRITDSDDDTLLTQFINGVSAGIERTCGVQFAARDYRERLNGVAQRKLTLKQWPVISITRMSWGRASAMTVHYSGSGIRAEVAVSAAALKINSVSTSGAATTNNLLFADYPSLSLLAGAINGVSGWSASVTVNMPSADLNPTGGTDARTQSVILTYPDRGDIHYTVEYETGILQITDCAGWGYGGLQPLHGRPTGYEAVAVFPGGAGSSESAHQSILVQYRAGYEIIPADVELMCNQLVADVFYDSTMPRNQTMSSLGPFTWKANIQQSRTLREELSEYLDISKSLGGV